jgi:transketolase
MTATFEKERDLALRVRSHAIRMARGGGCFLGASLSCADLLVFLYTNVLRVDPQNPTEENRDRLFLSKGHDVPALYGVLAELGFFDKARLENHLSPEDHLYWHPNRNMPGIEFHSGSLGHLLSVAAGASMAARIENRPSRSFVIVGDGELDEGSVWESLLVASAKKLDSLVVIVDRNQFQANVKTEDLIPLEPLQDKFAAFGASVVRIDGHDFGAMKEAFATLPREAGKPTVIIADTKRGRGLPSIEGKAERWFCALTNEEVEGLLQELHGAGETTLTSETRMVR